MRTKDLRTVEQEQAFFRGLRVREVAERLNCTEAHVLGLIRGKKLKAIDIGLGERPNFRVHVAEFERFVKASAA